MNPNYSYETSYAPFKENQALNKRRQCDEVLQFIKKGANNLLQISNLSGIPQAIVSARVNDLINEERAKYEGCIIFNNRKRKRIKPEIKITQTELFN
jgi:hypothetical protein